MRPIRYTFTAAFTLILFQLSITAFGQKGISFNINKPKEYDERVLRSEKSDQKKFTLPRRFIQNTVTHYNYVFNANVKLGEILERAKTSFKDDYSQLLPFYNFTLDATAADSIQLDSIIYKSSTGIALHDLRSDWADNLYLLWGASFYFQKKFDSAYLMFQFINYAFAPKEKDGYYRTIGSNRDGNSAFSISTKEKNSLPRRIFTEPPSRNDAFIWQIRNFLAQDELAESASLIVALKNDPVFPKRLHNDLHEVQALWFYKQSMWDSAATHLVQALSDAGNQQEKARWEYLAAQMFELAHNYKDAEKYYGKVSTHTTDPILDIYARLSSIRTNKDGGEKSIEKNVDQLLKMAKRDKYLDYRDIIYYMAAQMQLEGNNIDGALALLKKSTEVSSNNPAQRNKAFLQLAELSFGKQQYRQAYNFYDSLNLGDPSIKNPREIEDRKKTLGLLATNIEIIERQDSLQRIALMPEDERKDFVKKLVKQLRKQQGLKDEGTYNAGQGITLPNNNPTLFPSGDSRGEWYFYNTANRTRGQSEFKAKWGNRPNVDNWRRASSIIGIMQANNNQQQSGNNANNAGNSQANPEITFDALYNGLPLTTGQIQRSNDSIQAAMFALGKLYIQEIENCKAGTETLESLRSRFPQFNPMDEVLFNLYYCYNKNGETAKASAVKQLMGSKYATSNFTTIVNSGKDPQSKNTAKSEATRVYEGIYDQFIEGKFSEAIAAKKVADSIYGKNYWTPQLLYIEAVYYVKQRNDSTAITVLNSIVSQFPNTPLAAKASNLINVLGRRAQIEEELRNMVVVRATDSTRGRVIEPVAVKTPTTDSVRKVPTNPVVNNVPTRAPSDTVSKSQIPKNNTNTPFAFNPTEAHYVVLILNKVDPVFCNEAKNAFNRYNQETFYNKRFTLDLFQVDDDNRILMIAPFANIEEALTYVDKTKPKTANEILPWLKGGKYSFSVMSTSNYNLLKENKNIEGYKTFLNQYLPGRF